MTSKQANSISIKELLDGMNVPKKGRTYYGMYFSPFRAEAVPSFKVDYRKNLWYDFGAGEGGTMIDLVMKLYRCTFPEAMKILEGKGTPTFILPKTPTDKTGKTILQNVLPLGNSALTEYLFRRGISIVTALCQCKEIHYEIDGKSYYAIGFKNDAGGYELRNRYFKGSVSPKGITTFSIPTNDCIIFEGFMDYLSYLTMENLLHPQTDTVVLNSAVFLDRAMDFLCRHDVVHAYLQNDSTGKRVLSALSDQHGHVIDFSGLYEKYKDLNECLVNQINNNQENF